MSETMTAKPGEIVAGVVMRPEKEVHPLSKYWKAVVPIFVGPIRSTLFASARDWSRFFAKLREYWIDLQN
jgi:hypothetical protein